ncbi:HdaA/DnaA family protein [Minwuia sp.]|uniref:HdaA/DnaA family protein n=1 Tax=Minwuia sp. TaxID=2493630 RepID=UPI003A915C71
MNPEQLIIQFAQTTTYAQDQFLPADCNRRALARILDTSGWTDHALIIHGPPRCGKTHLSHIWAALNDGHLINGVDLTFDAVPGLSGRSIVVENAENAEDPRVLFHLYNLQREDRGRLLMVSRRPPAGWGYDLPDLTSRIAATPTEEIIQPGEDLLGPLLVKLAADRQMVLPPDVVQYMLKRLERSFAAAERIVKALDDAALKTQQRISLPLARKIMDGTDV